MNKLINGWIKSTNDGNMPVSRGIWWSPTSALDIHEKEKKEIKQNQHILGLYGECILYETNHNIAFQIVILITSIRDEITRCYESMVRCKQKVVYHS